VDVVDFLMTGHIGRRGDVEHPSPPRTALPQIGPGNQALALPAERWPDFPTTTPWPFSLVGFATTHGFDPKRDTYRLAFLSDDDEWQELDFYRHGVPKMSRTLLSSCTCEPFREFLLRVFCRFPNGRPQLEDIFKSFDVKGIDWQCVSTHGSIALKPDAPQLPAGTEVALLQF